MLTLNLRLIGLLARLTQGPISAPPDQGLHSHVYFVLGAQDLNLGLHDYESSALPPELSFHTFQELSVNQGTPLLSEILKGCLQNMLFPFRQLWPSGHASLPTSHLSQQPQVPFPSLSAH